ncbi:MAG: 16S rRNA (cytidine(1402)-2'-O)-methyltransferase [Bacteroidetes bacterium]|nr:16S rRNA (cytidine(1402)-2'-O)-methyltransferase [Bacteroidota bacterium]
MLYIVPTPVGNLEDITLRALRILREAGLVLCEDTRQTRKLLDHYQISNQLQAYHKFNERRSCEPIIHQLSTGMDIALVSDGGTPGISDPGYILVEACMEAGIQVQCLPGATAFVPALVASGFDTSSFVFEGFLPHKKGRETLFKKFALEERVIILYESPYRVIKTLEQIHQFIGDQRLISISREISKMFEETVRGTAPELLEHFKKKEPRGEFVIILGPTSIKEREEED